MVDKPSLNEAKILSRAIQLLSEAATLNKVYNAVTQIFLIGAADRCTLLIFQEHRVNQRPDFAQVIGVQGIALEDEAADLVGYSIRLKQHTQPMDLVCGTFEQAITPEELSERADPPQLWFPSDVWTGKIATLSQTDTGAELRNRNQDWFNHFNICTQAMIPLFNRGGVYGLVLVDYCTSHQFAAQEIALFNLLAVQSATTIAHNLQLVNAQQRVQKIQFGAEISKVTNSILDPQRLFEQSVNLIQDGFEAYYVGLFLVDDAGEWAVLHAGTGAAGEAQMTAGHKLAVDDQSMIGWCVTHKEARIDLAVGEDNIRFDNPHLPLTRSEIALPLISRDIVLGALSIQSSRPSAFSRNDITTLQTMADQLANAILNSRLFQHLNDAKGQVENLYRMSYQIALATTVDEAAAVAIKYVPKASFDSLSISLFDDSEDPDNTWIRIAALWDVDALEDEMLNQRFSAHEMPIIKHATADREIIIEDIYEHPLVDEVTRQTYANLNIRSAIILPICVAQRVLGWLTATVMNQPQTYTEADITPLRTIVNQIGLVIDRLQKTTSLLDANKHYEAMVANIPGAVYRSKLTGEDDRHGFQYLGPQITEITGYSAQNILAQDISWLENVVHPNDQEYVNVKYQSMAQTQAPYRLEYRIITRNDEIRYISERGKGVFDDAGRLIHMDGILFDVTDRHLLSQAVERRAAQFEAIAEVGQAASAILDVGLLMTKTVDQISYTFGFYYAGFFLVDPDRTWAILQAGSGEAGKKMLAEGHRLKCDESSMVGWATFHGQARIALDVGDEPHRFDSPHLPLTRSEIALPLIARGRVIGALDVQSRQPNAFDTDDITTLQLMANQLANVIENARLLQRTEQNLHETEILYRLTGEMLLAKTEDELFKIFVTNVADLGLDSVSISAFLNEGQEQILEVKHIWTRYETSFQSGQRVKVSDFFLEPFVTRPQMFVIQDVHTDLRLTPAMRQHFIALDVYSIIIVPVMMPTLAGTVHLTYKKQPQTFTQSQIRLTESLVQQLSVVWQNLQLMASIERRYRREQIIREITGKIHATTGVDQVLQTTLNELSSVFNVPVGMAHLNIKPDSTGDGVLPAAHQTDDKIDQE